MPVGDAGYRLAHQVADAGHTLLVEEVAETVDEIVDDPETVNHHRSADLQVAGPEREKVDSVAPVGDTADARDGQIRGLCVAGDFSHHVQCDRLHGWSAVAAMGTHPVRRWIHRQAVVIDPHDRVDGVYQRDSIGTAILRGLRRWQYVRDVGCQLDDHRDTGDFLAPFRRHLDVLGHLADRGSHAALGHAVRAAEIELEGIGAGILDHRHVFRPGLLGHRQHNGNDERTVRPVALDLADFVEVRLERPVGYQLDIVEADDASVVAMYRRVPRAADVDDRRILAQRLPDRATPAGFESTIDVIGLVRRRRRGQPERVRGTNAEKSRSQVCHGRLPRSQNRK